MNTQSADDKALAEVRRLLLEREAVKKRLDGIDQAINLAVGISNEDRPLKERLSKSDFHKLVNGHERVPKKKRQSLDCRMV